MFRQLHLFIVILICREVVSYREEGAGRAREVLAQHVATHYICILCFQRKQVMLQVGEGVGDRLCKPDFLLVLLELICEGKSEIAFQAFPGTRVAVQHLIIAHPMMTSGLSRYLILCVLNVLAAAEPTFIFVFIGFDANLHAE